MTKGGVCGPDMVTRVEAPSTITLKVLPPMPSCGCWTVALTIRFVGTLERGSQLGSPPYESRLDLLDSLIPTNAVNEMTTTDAMTTTSRAREPSTFARLPLARRSALIDFPYS